MTVTYASMPIAMRAALVPDTPPPRITTLAAGTPGTPPSSTPMPPCSFSRQCAPTCTAIRPATSLIGASSGSPPRASVTVSYAIATAPDRISASASACPRRDADR